MPQVHSPVDPSLVPAGACDCHTHVFGDGRDFSWWEKRTYTPAPASSDDLLALLNRLHLSRVVIVHPSVYGADNSATLDGIRRLGTSEISPPIPVDDGALLNQLLVWAPDAVARRKILVDNPARLYGF